MPSDLYSRDNQIPLVILPPQKSQRRHTHTQKHTCAHTCKCVHMHHTPTHITHTHADTYVHTHAYIHIHTKLFPFADGPTSLPRHMHPLCSS